MFQYVGFAFVAWSCIASTTAAETYHEAYRPQFHFTPAENWMNDPNGLLYHDGVYHLYFQYNPGGITWGNISWGHAISQDLTHWEQLPVALLARGYPENVTEMFFSGSAIADTENTSGFGSDRETPFVAMYTSYYPYTQTLPSGKTVEAGTQAQSIAYSLDEGYTWQTYDKGNPVIAVPPSEYADQYENFRDPFVFWHSPTSKWVVVTSLAALHKLLIYTSPDLKNWTLASEFGPANAVGGVWECPSIFPLQQDGTTKWIAMIGLNPGGPPGVLGSGTQYFIGHFDGKTFTADGDSIYPAPSLPPDSIMFANFETNATFAQLGWTATGGLINAAPVAGTVSGQQTVSGYLGSYLVNTFLNGDMTVGTIMSPPFNISRKYINFLIGGGYAPGKEGIELLIGNETVRSATGNDAEALQWQGWDVTEYAGQTASIRIVDLLTSGWGHTNVDAISFSNTLATPQKANWMDFGPDFYAAATYNGLQVDDRTTIAWMNNWQYGAAIPTSPWRSAMSVPRRLSLGTVGGKTTILRSPTENWQSLEGRRGEFSSSWQSVTTGVHSLQLSGKTLDISLSFADQNPTAGLSPQFGILLRATSDLTQETQVGYDFTTKEIFVDRTKSGNSTFDSSFASVYHAPMIASADGQVSLRILLDWSSVEVFGGNGEVSLTAQVFPDDAGIGVDLFSTDTETRDVHLTATQIGSIYD